MPSPLTPDQILGDRVELYAIAMRGARIIGEIIEQWRQAKDEQGLPAILPRDVSGLLKDFAGLALLLGPLPGEARYLPEAPPLNGPNGPTNGPPNIDEAARLVPRLFEGEPPRKKRKKKTG